jgi:hypothetical protein
MRKVAITKRALDGMSVLAPADRRRAAKALHRLQREKDIPVRLLSTGKAPGLMTMQDGHLVIAFRELREQLVVLSIRKRVPA